MSVNAAGDDKKKTVIVVVASIVILVAIATIVSMAIPRSHKTLPPMMAQNMAEATSLANKCHGDYSQLSPQDQSRAFSLFGPLASKKLKEAYKPQ